MFTIDVAAFEAVPPLVMLVLRFSHQTLQLLLLVTVFLVDLVTASLVVCSILVQHFEFVERMRSLLFFAL